MASSARVRSIEALRDFRTDVARYAEEAGGALDQATGEIRRAIDWLQHDRMPYWNAEINRAREEVTHAKSALSRAKAMSFDQEHKTFIDERKALEKAQRRLQDAEQKLAATRKWARRLEKEFELYKGRVQPLSSWLQSDVPKAMENLSRMSGSLEEYVSIQSPGMAEEGPGNAASGGFGSASTGGQDSDDRINWLARAPGRRTRRNAERTDPDALEAGKEVLLDKDALKVIDALGIADEPSPEDDRVVVDPRALKAERIALIRMKRPALGDSGWYIGDASREEPPESEDLLSVTRAGLAEAMPEMRTVLDCRRGLTLVVSGGTIEGVYDDHGRAIHASGTESASRSDSRS